MNDLMDMIDLGGWDNGVRQAVYCYIYIYIYMSVKKIYRKTEEIVQVILFSSRGPMELLEIKRLKQVDNNHDIYIYIYMCVCVRVCVCLCLCVHV